MKPYTYTPTGHWTLDDIVTTTEYESEAEPKPDTWRLTPDLPFWWFLNPWKTVERLQDSLHEATVEANQWHEKHQQEAKVARSLSDQIYDLQNELEGTRSERDAANEAVRHLRKKRKR